MTVSQQLFKLLILFSIALPSSYIQAEQLLYTSHSGSGFITVSSISPKDGKLNVVQKVELNDANPGVICFSPKKDYAYVGVTGIPTDGSTPPKNGIASLKREQDGKLTLLSVSIVPNRSSGLKVDASGNYLIGSSYGDGEVTVYEIRDSVCTGKVLQTIKTDEKAHCVDFDPQRKFVYVPHTGPNKVFQFAFNSETGKLKPLLPGSVTGPAEDKQYHQPRHITMHPNLIMAYTSNERGGGISAWALDPNSGRLTLGQTLSSLPEGSDGQSAASDIRITPKGKFAYVANRPRSKSLDAKEAGDTIAGFSLDLTSGEMTRIGNFPTARVVRCMAIDPSGKYLFAGGTKDNKIKAYEIDSGNGKLKEIAEYEFGVNPFWLTILE